MSDGNGNKLEPIIPTPVDPDPIKPEESKDLHMEITFKDGKGIEVKGPGSGEQYNLPMCLFMLESAKDFIKGHNMKVNMGKIEIAKPGMMNRIGGAFGKHR